MKQEAKDKIYFLAGILVVISVSFLVNPNFTGASIFIEYFGVSDQLMDTQTGKMQTLITLAQPLLAELSQEEKRIQVASEIINSTDFAQGVTDFHKANLIVPVPSTEINKVKEAAKKEAANFQSDLTCLENIGLNHGHVMQRDFILISELKYVSCPNDKKNLFVYVTHTFFEDYNRKFVCSQDSDKLFLVKRDTGFVNTDVSNC